MHVVRYKPTAARIVPPAMQHIDGENSLSLSNIRHASDLDVSSEGNRLEFSLLQDTENDKEFRLDYKPNNEHHNVSVKYCGNHLEGSPFQLVPDYEEEVQQQQEQMMPQDALVVPAESQQNVSADLDPRTHTMTVSNVENFDDLDIDTKMGYSIFPGENEQQFKVTYQPQAGIHDIAVNYGAQPVDSFRLVPTHMQEAYERSQKLAQIEAPADGPPTPNPDSEPPMEVIPAPDRGQLLMSKLADEKDTTFNVGRVVGAQRGPVLMSNLAEEKDTFSVGRVVSAQREADRFAPATQAMMNGGSAPRYLRASRG